MEISFKNVSDFENYCVGSDGSVWSWKRSKKEWKKLKPLDWSNGYFGIQLYARDGRFRRVLLHRLVLEVFVGPCPEGLEGCHGKNGKSDNSVSNLRWDTHQANTLERVTKSVGETHHNAKLSNIAVHMVACLLDTGFSLQQIATEFGVTTGVVLRIKNGERILKVLEAA